MPPKGYLNRLREICDRHGILLIFNEVITGFGHVGKAFAAQLYDVTPDLMATTKGLEHIIDIRNQGLVVGIELSSREGKPGKRAYDIFTRCFQEEDLLIRVTGDIIALSPPLIINKQQIDQIFETLGTVIKEPP